MIWVLIYILIGAVFGFIGVSSRIPPLRAVVYGFFFIVAWPALMLIGICGLGRIAMAQRGEFQGPLWKTELPGEEMQDEDPQ